jgi:hypothetical protein
MEFLMNWALVLLEEESLVSELEVCYLVVSYVLWFIWYPCLKMRATLTVAHEGGISYFSGRYGWGCDNVLNYEVILANGSIVNASTTSNPDLYHALRGGSGTNFGLVSRFDLITFEQGPLWGGSKLYSLNYSDPLIDTFGKFVVDAPTDDFAHLYIAFVYAEALGGFFASTGPTYGRPVANASIFQDVDKIPAFLDETGIHNISYLAAALNQTTFSR